MGSSGIASLSRGKAHWVGRKPNTLSLTHADQAGRADQAETVDTARETKKAQWSRARGANEIGVKLLITSGSRNVAMKINRESLLRRLTDNFRVKASSNGSASDRYRGETPSRCSKSTRLRMADSKALTARARLGAGGR